MARINRNYATPPELYFKVVELAKKVSSNPNRACNEGLQLWVEKIEKELKLKEAS